MLKKVFYRVFTLKNVLFALLFGVISFVSRYLIINILNLDVTVFNEFLIVYVPSALVSKVAGVLLEGFLDKKAIIGPPIESKYTGFNLFADARPEQVAEVRSQLQDQERLRDHLASIDRHYDDRQESLNRFVNDQPLAADLVSVEDPANQGVRGFDPNGINQPYATNIANSPEIDRVCGKTLYPKKLDDNARRFLIDILRYHRPEVYGRFATKG